MKKKNGGNLKTNERERTTCNLLHQEAYAIYTLFLVIAILAEFKTIDLLLSRSKNWSLSVLKKCVTKDVKEKSFVTRFVSIC